MSTPAPHAADRIERLLIALESRMDNADQWLEPDELDGLRELLTHKDELLRDIKYRRAANLMWAHWRRVFAPYRGAVVALAAILAFVLSLRDDITKVIAWLSSH